MERTLLLASKSPRRRELLASLDMPVKIVDIEVEETLNGPVAANMVAETLAQLKSQGYEANRLKKDEVLVTADTVVVHGNKVLGKPHNEQEAYNMLRLLSGNSHYVYTGVCLKSKYCQHLFTEATEVWFKELSDEEINYYIHTYKPFDKAGAYGIQEWIGKIGITRIDGCYYNVMGLPLTRLYEELKQLK